jgi:hypothetical protein
MSKIRKRATSSERPQPGKSEGSFLSIPQVVRWFAKGDPRLLEASRIKTQSVFRSGQLCSRGLLSRKGPRSKIFQPVSKTFSEISAACWHPNRIRWETHEISLGPSDQERFTSIRVLRDDVEREFGPVSISLEAHRGRPHERPWADMLFELLILSYRGPLPRSQKELVALIQELPIWTGSPPDASQILRRLHPLLARMDF